MIVGIVLKDRFFERMGVWFDWVMVKVRKGKGENYVVINLVLMVDGR